MANPWVAIFNHRLTSTSQQPATPGTRGPRTRAQYPGNPGVDARGSEAVGLGNVVSTVNPPLLIAGWIWYISVCCHYQVWIHNLYLMILTTYQCWLMVLPHFVRQGKRCQSVPGGVSCTETSIAAWKPSPVKTGCAADWHRALECYRCY